MTSKGRQPPSGFDPRSLSRALHESIAHVAISRGWLSLEPGQLDELLDMLPTCAEAELVDVWVEACLLTEAQASDIVDNVLSARRTRIMKRIDPVLLGLTPADPVDRVANDARDDDDDDDTHRTLGHDQTLVRQRVPPARSTGSVPALDPATSSLSETLYPGGPTAARPSSGGTWPADPHAPDAGRGPELIDSTRGLRDLAQAQAPDSGDHDLSPTPANELPDRYVIEEEIGRGGSGRVFRAYDRALGRVVAMKVLRLRDEVGDREQRLQRFLAEARGTGRLEHPNIVPIYDVGVLADGQPYYTMKLLRRHSLREVLRQLAAQDEATRREYRLGRLLNVFLPVCQAVAYAHAHQVVHRDLKPDNIMLGDYGEVLVTDWGLARSLVAPAEQLYTTDDDDETPDARPATLGTPAYMPPEQAMGRLDEVDELSDIYGLGAILYEILTLQPPYDGPSAMAVLEMVVDGALVPPGQRAAGRHVPRILEEICLRAMHTDRARRFPTALDLHDEVQGFLEGRQAREATRKVYLGRTASREYFRCIDEIDTLDAEVQALRDSVAASAPIEHKRPLWRAEDALERLWGQLGRAYSDAVRSFTQALAYNPNDDDARRGLADLYWSRFQQAESRKNLVDQVHFEALVRQMDREQRYLDLLEGNGTLTLTTAPADVRVTLSRFRERNRVLETWGAEEIGRAPLRRYALEKGSYVVELEAPGHLPAIYPVHLERCGHWRGHVELLPSGRLPDGFAYVPGGPFVSAGDPGARVPEPATVVDLPGFALARDLVTFGEYLEFLDHLQQIDPEQAARRVPQTRDGDGILARLGDDGRWHPAEILIEGEARKRYPAGDGHERRLPVMCIDVFDAMAYLDWRGQLDGRRYRLPTLLEMEKASRGVDGRAFPWGDHFDATFCKMRLSRPELPQPEPIGVFAGTDVSVYGVRDLAGTLQNWVRDERWGVPADAGVPDDDAPPGCLPNERVPESTAVHGGAWNHFEQSCRAASWIRMLSIGRSVSVGIRLAMDVTGDDGQDDEPSS